MPRGNLFCVSGMVPVNHGVLHETTKFLWKDEMCLVLNEDGIVGGYYLCCAFL